ncbi:MAG TPA: GNAT family N-acetyltransferase, partial [Candidatus Methylomirabilis sp.]|nr:GNAT family N-acetyltransferase [Candidatus Methylomirabilis sp.]
MLEAYELHPDVFTATVAERVELPLGWWEARMADAPNANEAVFGAFVDGTLAGVAGIRFETREKTAHKATLFGLYVPQRFRKLGLG